ncbi:MAG: serine hydrolase [Bacteroidota bacterium]
MKYLPFTLLLAVYLFSCNMQEPIEPDPSEEEDPKEELQYYFPPTSGNEWESTSTNELEWNEEKLQELYTYLENQNTRAFIVLKEGKMVVEKYWGRTITDDADFGPTSNWYWASAGKSLTALNVGIAQEEGLLDINQPSSTYLGNNWTNLTREEEDKITVWNQLTMTTGLDYEVSDLDCTEPSCLNFKAEPGTQWFYHNGPYTLLEKVVSQASGLTYNAFTNNRVEEKVGMNGAWISSGYNNVYWSTARDAARFGLLILNEGRWENEAILQDSSYFQAMVNSSQELNPAYGYLWWLNGKSSVILPGLPTGYNIAVAPKAPSDLFAAMGKNGQIIDVVPSQDLVVVRMGNAPENSLVPIIFHNDMWEILSGAMNL